MERQREGKINLFTVESGESVLINRINIKPNKSEMKRFTFVSVMAFILVSFFDGILLSQPRVRESFNDNWKFIKYFNASDEIATTDKEPAGLQAISVNDNSWRSVESAS